MKLVEILARELKEWPVDGYYIGQALDGVLHIDDSSGEFIRHTEEVFTLCSNVITDYVTRAQWEAERVRIAANQQATQEAREIARTGSMTSEEQELAGIACGKRSKDDQELWDKLAIAAMQGLLSSGATYKGSTTNRDLLALDAFAHAEAFMAERAKRMNG